MKKNPMQELARIRRSDRLHELNSQGHRLSMAHGAAARRRDRRKMAELTAAIVADSRMVLRAMRST